MTNTMLDAGHWSEHFTSTINLTKRKFTLITLIFISTYEETKASKLSNLPKVTKSINSIRKI